MKLENNWKYKSLYILEKIHPHKPEEAPTRLVKRCYELIYIPLNEFSIEDLRLMIGQEFGLNYLIPLAIEQLENDLYAEGDFYPGDLLSNVLKINTTFWKQNKGLWEELEHLISGRRNDIVNRKIPLNKFYSVKG